jgi:hypothetical protein
LPKKKTAKADGEGGQHVEAFVRVRQAEAGQDEALRGEGDERERRPRQEAAPEGPDQGQARHQQRAMRHERGIHPGMQWRAYVPAVAFPRPVTHGAEVVYVVVGPPVRLGPSGLDDYSGLQ